MGTVAARTVSGGTGTSGFSTHHATPARTTATAAPPIHTAVGTPERDRAVAAYDGTMGSGWMTGGTTGTGLGSGAAATGSRRGSGWSVAGRSIGGRGAAWIEGVDTGAVGLSGCTGALGSGLAVCPGIIDPLRMPAPAGRRGVWPEGWPGVRPTACAGKGALPGARGRGPTRNTCDGGRPHSICPRLKGGGAVPFFGLGEGVSTMARLRRSGCGGPMAWACR